MSDKPVHPRPAQETPGAATPRQVRPGLDARQTLADVGEFGLVDMLAERYPARDHVLLGPGDDAAVLRVRGGHVVVSTDMLVEGKHFRRDWATGLEIGQRAAAQALADLSAMGADPHSVTLGVAAPASLPAQWVLDLADGIDEVVTGLGASVVGGDLTAADQVVLSVTVLGSCAVAPVERSGAQAGDVIALAGRQGWAAAGLAVLGRGFRSPRVVVEAFKVPQPPYAAGPQAAKAGATAMVDVSDGLVADLEHVARASGVCCAVDTTALEVPEPLQAVGAALNTDPMRFVLGGGEDHALLATFPSGVRLPEGWRAIGRCHAPDADHAPGSVTVDARPYDGPHGHSHF